MQYAASTHVLSATGSVGIHITQDQSLVKLYILKVRFIQ